MDPIEGLHDEFQLARRVRVLAVHIAAQLPRDASVLDVGTGDGQIAAFVAQRRPDVSVRGIDVLVREHPAVPVQPFDGRNIPFEDGSFDAITLIDVLHHAEEPVELLRQAARVARRAIVIKDHIEEGFLARATLRFMDHVGNRRFGIPTPDSYWTEAKWRQVFDELGLRVVFWDRRLGLYPKPLGWLFDRGLHCLARLSR